MSSSSNKSIFPGAEWETALPAEVGMNAEKVSEAERWFEDSLGDDPGRLVIVKDGRVVLQHYCRMAKEEKLNIASAAKSIYSNVIGILVEEGGLKSVDEPVAGYYPEMMEVREGEGNKPGRHAFPANRGITFRHLITNVSGYMKPGEEPGKVFNYQSWGMNVLTHAIAKIYGLYDASDPEKLPGFQALIKEKLADKIGAKWEYKYTNPKFNDRLQKGARLDIFGYFTQVHSTALDLARVGWLWCNWGKWNGVQLVPEKWLRETSVVAPDILANCPKEQWKYGHGIWTNSEGECWPILPREAFGSSGAGGHFWTVFPSKGLVVVQNPGRNHRGDRKIMSNPEMLKIIVDACDAS